MERICPKGHVSTDPDYCSECGAKLGGAASAITPTLATAPSALAVGGEPCPVCATQRVAGARFCEVCRYDFQTETTSPAPASPKVPTLSSADLQPHTPTPEAPPASVFTSAEPVAQHWDIIIGVDPTLNKNPDPAQPCPQNDPERTFPLDLDENLVGRRSDKKDIHPEIMIADPGISRRHLSIRRRDDGGLLVIELGSTNGTSLNAAPLEPGIPTPLKDGDQLTLGCWTRLTIRAR
jgi:hypothetical protein